MEERSSVEQCRGGTLEQYGETVWNSMVEQCGTMWHSVVEQYGGTVEQCGGTVWNGMVEHWNGVVEV